MGRTNSTYRNHLDEFIERFSRFRRGLRSQNKEHLDSLWEKAHKHASAASYMNPDRPALPALVSILVGLQKDIDGLEKRVEKIEKQQEKCSR